MAVQVRTPAGRATHDRSNNGRKRGFYQRPLVMAVLG
jgi:hypothetical protein